MEAVTIALAAYYLTAVLTRTDGPGGVLYKLRRVDWLPFHCATCTAFWAASLACLLQLAGAWQLVAVLAIAGAVTFAEDIRQSLLK